ncbi:MAG: hypothetical protein V5A23_09020 [Halobacteriales archaeon]
MARSTRRPFGVIFAATWGLVQAGMLTARATGQSAVPALLPEAVLDGALLVAAQGLLAVLLLLAGVFVYRQTAWARRPAMFAFLLAGATTAATLIDFSMLGFVIALLDASAVVVLVMHADAFHSERPEIDDSDSASKFGV